MREIKFRAWDKTTKFMFDIDMIKFCHNPDMLIVEGHRDNTYSSGYDFESMQYTGLKDKNKKEIYEGDIIQKNGINFEVWWSKLGACFFCRPKRLIDRKERPDKEGFDEVELYEVIGNVYENPELLGGVEEKVI